MPSRPHVNHPLGFLKGFLHLQRTPSHSSAAEGARLTSCLTVYGCVTCTAPPTPQTHPTSTCSFVLMRSNGSNANANHCMHSSRACQPSICPATSQVQLSGGSESSVYLPC